ncbi:polymeric immunoglobulin receptor-like [Paramisgurnus dabryanus]|uniref:polymeric immunoglobulin receptor-like n=1 Tax=Paramisgurnus dabryanus TaxID=90735 RepID=UPI0031F468F0
MRDLQHQNTGYYWCAVENEEDMTVTEWFNITIQSVPDLSVMSSNVTVDEGGNISLQCLYTSTYKNKTKQWCRYKDKGCYTVGRSDTSQNASVKISDDGRGSLTVVMSGLMKSDSGWYYCSVGDLQVPVQLSVTAVITDRTSMKDIQYDDLKMWLLPIALLLILVTVTSIILRNKHSQYYITFVFMHLADALTQSNSCHSLEK